MNWRSIRKACTPDNVKRYLRESILCTNQSNTRVVFSIMLGAFIATSPFWGFQSLLCVILAFVFRLNKVLSTAVASLNLPFIPVILFVSYAIGCAVYAQPISLHLCDMNQSILHSIFKPYLVGSLILSTGISLLSGAVFAPILHYTRRQNAR